MADGSSLVERLRAEKLVTQYDSAGRLISFAGQPTELEREAATEIERLRAELASLKMRAGTLAVHVRGHFAMASETSPAICLKWADAVHEAVNT